jgi:hypothetical protein
MIDWDKKQDFFTWMKCMHKSGMTYSRHDDKCVHYLDRITPFQK